MDRRFLTVLGLSLVFALVVTSIFYQLSSHSGPKKPEVTDMKDVVIAAKNLPTGQTLKAEDIKVNKIPAGQFPKGAFSKPEDIIGRPVISNILAEEPILDGRLAQRGSGIGLAPVIPVGMRAVTVRVNDVVGVAGFVLPGMRVDVLITGDPPGTGMRMTRTVLQNITVLSAGQNMQTDNQGKPVNAPSVTLLVSPPQAETLTLAGTEAKIQLVLRNGGDQNIEKTTGLSISELYGAKPKENTEPAHHAAYRPRPESRPLPTITPAAPPADQIVAIRGVDKKVETVSARRVSPSDAGRNP